MRMKSGLTVGAALAATAAWGLAAAPWGIDDARFGASPYRGAKRQPKAADPVRKAKRKAARKARKITAKRCA